MSRDGSVAPKERINIRYVPATGDTQEATNGKVFSLGMNGN